MDCMIFDNIATTTMLDSQRDALVSWVHAGGLLVAIGIWLANAMVDARRADDCLSSGRRNCAPHIEAPAR
jgi:hypothetical protein